MLHMTADLGRFFGTTSVTENGHEIWNLECQRVPTNKNRGHLMPNQPDLHRSA
jgi:hypothetical protein